MKQIQIPAKINSAGLLDFLSLIGQEIGSDGVELDFSSLRRVTPPGLVALVATVLRWHREHRPVEFTGLNRCAITGYLQRMNVFQTCGVDWPENFTRHNARGRFVPVRLVDHRVEEMGSEMAVCLAPGGDDYGHPMADLYDLAWYVLTEVANNIRQHSGGLGYVSAQVNDYEGLVRLALADNGRGILGSFQESGFPWSKEMDDAGAIRKALESRVSSKVNDQNEGVGLTLVSELARITGAWLLIISGSGVLQMSGGGESRLSVLPEGGRYQGTLVSLTVGQKKVQDFANILEAAKIRAGLLRSKRASGNFSP